MQGLVTSWERGARVEKNSGGKPTQVRAIQGWVTS